MTSSDGAADRPAKRGPGRPPDANGEETRRQILQAARNLFAEHGFAGTTTRMIADEVGVTTAALHHYFGRKTNLALALWWTTTDTEFARLAEAMDGQDTFERKVLALLEATVASIRADPESTRFIVSIREDARRTPELAEIIEDTRLAVLVRGLVDHGVDEGVVNGEHSSAVRGVISAVLVGVTTMSADVSLQRVEQMAAGCRRLMEGALFHVARPESSAQGR